MISNNSFLDLLFSTSISELNLDKDLGVYVYLTSLSILCEITLSFRKFIALGEKAAKYIFFLFPSTSNSKETGIPSLSDGVNNIIESNLVSTSLGVKASILNSIFDKGVKVVTAAKDDAKRFMTFRLLEYQRILKDKTFTFI